MKPDVRKLLILNLPYLIFVYLFGKVGQAYRLAAGADLSGKLLHFADGFSAAFANPLPSLHPFDLCIGTHLEPSIDGDRIKYSPTSANVREKP